MDGNLLTWMVFTPLLGALALYLVPASAATSEHDQESSPGSWPTSLKLSSERFVALIFTLITFVLSLLILRSFNSANGDYQLVERADWIPSFGVTYYLGIDGISLVLVLLTTVLMPLVVLASNSVHSKVRGYLASMLALESAMLGTLVSLDLFLFYVFWELMLAPMYFIIGIWGGKRRIYATLKFVLYTVVGSLLMLVAIIFVVWQYYHQHGEVTFSLPDLTRYSQLGLGQELWLFGAFALAFGIKVPVFPFHTWLPDAHVEAPTGGSVVLAGVLLKMGIYGMIRFAYPLFPRAAEIYAPYIAVLAVIGIIYGALVAWAQDDIKKLVAYSSVSHLGFCVLGLVAFNEVALSGALYQSLNHGISGLASKVPIFAFLFLVFTLSSIALPLTNGFIGEFMILSGSFKVYPQFVLFAVAGVVLGAVYMLTLYMRTMYGELDESKNGSLSDVNKLEMVIFAPLLVLVFVMGIYPQPILRTMDSSVKKVIADTNMRAQRLNQTELALESDSHQQVVWARRDNKVEKEKL
ncbi:MAG: Fe-S-binding domain-containing protein [Proteobacteria bacterium]|nr:MAG: Fe-S-binding domain-containing protein [Pseudomonadota bacterium]